MYRKLIVCILFVLMIFCACTQNRGYRGGVRGSRAGSYEVEDVDRTHRDIHKEYQEEQEEYQEKQQEQEDSYGY